MRYQFIAFLLAIAPIAAQGYDSGKAGFSIDINGEINPYSIYSTFVLPSEVVLIRSTTSLAVWSADLEVRESELGWQLIAPSTPGVARVFIDDGAQNNMTINILVLTLLKEKKGEYLNGYRIGNYPSVPLRGNPIYNEPKGLFEVTKENEDLQLMPHFTMKQFLCKQAGAFPKYVILRERLLLKLEYLLEIVNQKGYETETFGFISGYRTPYYNASIKNVAYSRHVYGGAADIMIDRDGNGSLDDLNGDGRIDEKDVQVFYDLVEGEIDKSTYNVFEGGLGFYKRNGRHNGFIHVDVRGWKARW